MYTSIEDVEERDGEYEGARKPGFVSEKFIQWDTLEAVYEIRARTYT